jgi:hypothetical protein
MRMRCWKAAGVLAAALAGFAAPAAGAEKPTKEEIAAAEKQVREYLAKQKGDAAKATAIQDDVVAKMLPGKILFGVVFPRYPRAVAPPKGISASSVFVAGDPVKPLNNEEEMFFFVRENLPKIETDDQAKDAARVYMRLFQEFHQDGYYKFKLMADSTKVSTDGDMRLVEVVAVVMDGGNGTLKAKLKFDAEGKLASQSGMTELKPGVRPKCQATKLLDADPDVRLMAERDLLCMGRAARPYLDEQRAKASPELQQAIDRIWRRICDQDR